MYSMAPITLDFSTPAKKIKQRVARVGVEVEGAWLVLPKGCREVHRDTSVFRNGGAPSGTIAIGELVSPALECGEVGKWMKVHFPQAWDATCGLHVHMSFNRIHHYLRVMDPRYPPTIIQALQTWAEGQLGLTHPDHPIWRRLQGRNRYCKFEYTPDAQARVETKEFDPNAVGSRYTAVNYCYRRYGTVECRVLPMMDLDIAIAAVHQIITVTNLFLSNRPKRGKKAVTEVEEEPQLIEQVSLVV